MTVSNEDLPVVRIAELGSGPTEVSRARRELARSLDGWGVAGRSADTAILLANELVTNAIRHGAAPVTLSVGVQQSSGRLRVEVHDCSPAGVVPRRADDGDIDGRGLFLVDALADDWGSGAVAPGKNVWFQLSTLADAG